MQMTIFQFNTYLRACHYLNNQKIIEISMAFRVANASSKDYQKFIEAIK